MAYIKSHSNFVLKSKHKTTNDGTIFERDYTTIGGIDNFSPDKTPIYRSGNFLITINNEMTQLKQHASNHWEENEDGEVWTISHVNNISSNTEHNDNKIVIKNDYYDLIDFAYYGSCSELVRGSLNDILTRFPGELYVTNDGESYTDVSTNRNKIHEDNTYDEHTDELTPISAGTLDNTNTILTTATATYYFVDNPFKIDVCTTVVNEKKVENKLKYLAANGWFKNYVVINNDSEQENEIIDCTVIEYDCDNCKSQTKKPSAFSFNPTKKTFSISTGSSLCGVFETVIKTQTDTINLYSVKFKGQTITYALKNKIGYHIRPKKEFLDEFYNSLDSFESVILNPHTEPKYKASFQIIKEGDYSYSSKIEDFVFPIGRGGYNIGSDKGAYNAYLTKFLTTTEYYDLNFSDNLYRMMTHESIKNFDWTYHIPNDNAEQFNEGGDKIQKLIRLFGREFDEIKFYIDGINDFNNITYSDKNNIPDYFLTDALEIEGWDLNNIYPLKLTCGQYECSDKHHKKFVSATTVTGTAALQNTQVRLFSNIIDTKIKPYSKTNLNYPNGYFEICDNSTSNTLPCSGNYYIQAALDNQKYLIESSSTIHNKSILRRRIRKYNSEKEYSFKDINTMFMKRLKLNSRNILRHKGTIEGVEMIFGMFGMKSKNFIESCQMFGWTENIENIFDYEINEYISFTSGIEDPYWCCKEMNRMNWYNSTKSILYDTRFFKDGNYTNYQGLPIAYREKGDDSKSLILYPYYNEENIVDGEFYYQMKGGWLQNEPYIFDNDNNIVVSENSQYNKLYTETVNSVKVVNNIEELVNLPINTLSIGDVYKVNNLNGQYLIIEGHVYAVYKDFNNNEYIIVKNIDNTVTIGESVFYQTIAVSNPNGVCNQDSGNDTMKRYYLPSLENGEIIKIYLDANHKVIVRSEINAQDSAMVLSDNQIYVNNTEKFSSNPNITKEDNAHNYFLLKNPTFSDMLNGDGWNQLDKSDSNYTRLNSITNYFKGNNPHNGNLIYDGGFAYVDYFANLFNYSYNNNLFDYRQYGETFYDELETIGSIGFKKLTVGDTCTKCYYTYKDSKIHYFGNWFNIGDDNDRSNDWEVKTSDDNYNNVVDSENKHYYDIVKKYDVNNCKSWYDYEDYTDTINQVNLLNDFVVKDYNNTTVCKSLNVDGSTFQIVNTKVFEIIIYLCNNTNNMLSKESMEEIKFYQSVVMPYITQMIPSTTILKVEYKLRNGQNVQTVMTDLIKTESK